MDEIQAHCLRLNQDPAVVHIWSFLLDLPPAVLAECAGMLTAAERERAGRFRFPRDQDRFIAGRGQLRAILGRYLQTNPARLEFSYGPQGKPALAGEFAQSGLYFNLAHSAHLAFLAVTRSGPVGVDLERLRPLADTNLIVARFFSPRENDVFQALPEDQESAAFFNLWTRKEAWLKATGIGIGQFLDRVEVTFVPGEPARLLSLPGGPEAVAQWRLNALAAPPGFAAAVVAPAAAAAPECFAWHGGHILSAEK